MIDTFTLDAVASPGSCDGATFTLQGQVGAIFATGPLAVGIFATAKARTPHDSGSPEAADPRVPR